MAGHRGSAASGCVSGLRAIYDWYERNADLAACVLRDAEYHALTREIAELRFGPPMAGYHEVLGAKLNAKQRACCDWRSASSRGGRWRARVA